MAAVAADALGKEIQIVYRLFLVNCYLLHVPRLPTQPASSGRGCVIDFIWLELPWQYIAMTRNKPSIISISLNSRSKRGSRTPNIIIKIWPSRWYESPFTVIHGILRKYIMYIPWRVVRFNLPKLIRTFHFCNEFAISFAIFAKLTNNRQGLSRCKM